MVSSQKLPAPVASPNAKPSQPVAHNPSPVATVHSTTPATAGPHSTCFVHRLEDALELVESMHLTSDQKTKIAHLTAAQTARCNEEKRLHRTTHEQILALLTPDQHQTLQASENSDHGHKNHASADVELAAHA